MQKEISKKNKKYGNEIEGFGKNKESPPIWIFIFLGIFFLGLIVWGINLSRTAR